MNKNIVLIVAILLLAFLLRAGTFFLPHDSWDQVYYTCVAMKLDTQGFAGYNLRHVGFDEKQDRVRVYVETDDAKTFLSQRKELSAYDEPVFYAPPVLPFLLKVSHDIFARGNDHLFISGRIWKADREKHSLVFYGKEFYKTVVPLIFSLLTILLAMLFCFKYIGSAASFYAGFLLSVNPVDIMTANKIWTDDIFTLFFTATLMLFYYACQNDRPIIVFLSGITAGLAMLTRNFGIILWPLIFIYHFCFGKNRTRKTALFLLASVLIASPWFWLMIKTYGKPLHQPNFGDSYKHFPFVVFTMSRPWYTYIVNIIVQNPVWILAGGIFWVNIKSGLKNLFTLWIMVPLIILTGLRHSISAVGIEDRYMLPAYPALAIAASLVISDLKTRKLIGPAVTLLTLLSCIWSIYIAVVYTYRFHLDCIPMPL